MKTKTRHFVAFVITILLVQNSFSQNSGARMLALENLYLIGQDYPCDGEVGRTIFSLTLELEVGKYKSYFGQTNEGDLAVVYHDQGKTILELFLCERIDFSDTWSIEKPLILNASPDCFVDEITEGIIVVEKNKGGVYRLEFGSIHQPDINRYSSLCGDDDY